MNPKKDPKYVLAFGTQVRAENFGLLFYTMRGPRLYFLSSGRLLDSAFFQGELTLDQWVRRKNEERPVPEKSLLGIGKALEQLKDAGVIFEC